MIKFEVFNEDGTLQLDLTSRLTKLLGSFNVTTQSGSFVDPSLSLGTPWYIITGTASAVSRNYILPNITFSGNPINTISWADGSGPGYIIAYGVYSNGSN